MRKGTAQEVSLSCNITLNREPVRFSVNLIVLGGNNMFKIDGNLAKKIEREIDDSVLTPQVIITPYSCSGCSGSCFSTCYGVGCGNTCSGNCDTESADSGSW